MLTLSFRNFLATLRPSRNGEWSEYVRAGSNPMMRRYTVDGWESREMTNEEVKDYVSSEAW